MLSLSSAYDGSAALRAASSSICSKVMTGLKTMESASTESTEIGTNNCEKLSTSTTKKIAKTAAHRQKEYRQRLKAKKSIKKYISKKTSAQYQKEYRQRLKNNKRNEASDTLPEAPKKTALRSKEYRDKIKVKGQRSQLDNLLKEEEKILQITKKHKLDNVQDEARQKLIATGNAMPTNHTQQSMMRLHDNTEDNSFRAPYEQHRVCSMPNAILRHFIDIPEDGNCLFFSLIKVLQLQITPSDLRKQLRESPYFHTCQNPNNARAILISESEYGDLDCLFIFSRTYNQNICVHFHFLNRNTNKEDAWFCYFMVNNSQNFIHLHLRNQHFTPYIETQKIIIDNRMNSQQNKDILFETSTDVEIDAAADKNYVPSDTELDGDNVVIDMEVEETNVTIPIYTSYHNHSSGHVDFHNDFKKNTFGHSCAVCVRLWWEKDLKKTSHIHNNILQTILPLEKLQEIKLETPWSLEESDISDISEQENSYIPYSASDPLSNMNQISNIKSELETTQSESNIDEFVSCVKQSFTDNSPENSESIITDKSAYVAEGPKDSFSQNRKENEFDVFGKYVATQLQRLPLEKALELEAIIYQLIMDTRLKIVRSIKESTNR